MGESKNLQMFHVKHSPTDPRDEMFHVKHSVLSTSFPQAAPMMTRIPPHCYRAGERIP